MTSMPVEALRKLSSAHGVLAWIGVAALALAAWLVARRSPGGPARALTLAVAAAATSLLSITGALGFLLHAPYQSRLRQRIFLQSPAMGWLFERKEHLAFGSLGLAWCALAAILALRARARRRRPLVTPPSASPERPDPVAFELRRAALWAYAASALLAAAAAIASALVARRHGF